MAPTPMMQQYHEAKQTCGDALLLFRMGDFYELFFDDAKIAARTLGITLTSRDKGENPIPMAGFPHHQLDSYLAKIIGSGLRAAVCEQVEDPKEAKGLVKREVTRVVTPGTLTDDALLDPRENNFLAAVAFGKARGEEAADEPIGLAWAELSTGRFEAASFPRRELFDQLGRVAPAECLLAEDIKLAKADALDCLLTRRPAWCFGGDEARRVLGTQFEGASLEGFGFEESDSAAIRAAGAVIEYLQETQKTSLDHIDRLIPYRSGSSLEIDAATRRSLELTRTIREGNREGSLLAVLDRTVTAMGSRMLASWLSSPLTDREAITSRHDAVAELAAADPLRGELRDQLDAIYDTERLLSRVTTGRASPRDLSFIGRTLSGLPRIKAKLTGRSARHLQQLEADIDLCADVRGPLEAALAEDCPLTAREGGFVRSGHNEQLDQLKELANGGKKWIAKYCADEAERIGVPNLKVGFNRVFGYYLEMTGANKSKAPEEYIRKQTLKNAERYITPELKEYEEKVVSADEKAKELEFEIFTELRDMVHAAARRLQATAAVLAELDCLCSLAELAKVRAYCRPSLTDDNVLEIVDGRHPVLDITQPAGEFVPNDVHVGGEHGLIQLITGPNMAGKSTYIRQVALLTIMAQMGSFVPARQARIGLADRVFARVGASDELSRGQSTFMVEMTETARILNTASDRSLVILDEIGRGTSTYDGVSLAWAIVEHLHDRVGCRTFFATHYHELTELADSLPQLHNLNVSVKEWEESIIFLHKIVPGAADKSYGIHVARLAGVPKEVNRRAQEILNVLEDEHLDSQGRSKMAKRTKPSRNGGVQMTLFAPYDHPLLEEIREADLPNMTPMSAMALIEQWQAELAKEKK